MPRTRDIPQPFHLPSNQTLSYIPGLQLSPSPPDGCHPPDPSSRALCKLGGTHPRLLVGGKLGALPPRPPPPAAVACLRLSRRCECSRELSRDLVGCDRCMKLQKLRERCQSGSRRIASCSTYPPLVHSPISFCRQQASLKSVTGESSAYRGLPDEFARHSHHSFGDEIANSDIPAYHRLFRSSTAFCASASHSYRA